MKYMGSKRSLLDGALGGVLAEAITDRHKRFIDLFTGSGLVAWHVAERYEIPVLAVDLQEFAVTLARSVVGRTSRLNAAAVWSAWEDRAANWLDDLNWTDGATRGLASPLSRESVADMRRDASAVEGAANLTRAYGGHYFSTAQSLWLDALRATIPESEPERAVALASLVRAASRCSASPGHTAQPLSPTESGWPHIRNAWMRDIKDLARAEFTAIAERHAMVAGSALVGSAEDVAVTLGPEDIAFVDPPYSAVQYSRFYHVLESIVGGEPGDVSGRGRYPASEQRPRSEYSLKSKAKESLDLLLRSLAERGVRTVLTFPRDDTSLGISGKQIQTIGEAYFRVTSTETNGRFSTLGGLASGRKARVPSYELLLDMVPGHNA